MPSSLSSLIWKPTLSRALARIEHADSRLLGFASVVSRGLKAIEQGRNEPAGNYSVAVVVAGFLWPLPRLALGVSPPIRRPQTYDRRLGSGML